MLDNFDHGREGEPGDERASLPGDVGGRLGIGEEEEEIQDRSCSVESVMQKIQSRQSVIESEGNPLSSPSVQESTTGDVEGGNDIGMNEWQCDFPSCGRVFDKRHDRNRHKKYHFKPFKCQQPLCKASNVAFSLPKDLKRHQSSHEGERFFCPHLGCSHAAGGEFTGFARLDNWRRHLETQHFGFVEYGAGPGTTS